MENASDSCGPSTVLPMNLVALTPVCSVPKLHGSPENMRCLERSFNTIALHARNHLRSILNLNVRHSHHIAGSYAMYDEQSA